MTKDKHIYPRVNSSTGLTEIVAVCNGQFFPPRQFAEGQIRPLTQYLEDLFQEGFRIAE